LIADKEFEMRTSLLILTLALASFAASTGLATDAVVIESKSVFPGATNVPIHISFANSDTIAAFALPLEVREITPGAFITSLSISYGERLTTALPDIRQANQYDTADGICMIANIPTYAVPYTRSADSVVTVTHAPWGLLCASFRYSAVNSLFPGSDSAGSIVLTVDVTADSGRFEIDTICVSHGHHLVYARNMAFGVVPIIPEFTKGVITITGCDCSYHGDLDGDEQITSLDQSLLINWVYMGIGPPPADATCPHVDRGDVNCDGQDDALDVAYMTDYLYMSGPAPCDPCECNPYPSNCP
jgi:hypothetical protein